VPVSRSKPRMDTELKRFLHDQKRLKRGLPPVNWPLFKKELAERNRLGRTIQRISKGQSQCSECAKPLPADRGRFFTDRSGTRWVCPQCSKQLNYSAKRPNIYSGYNTNPK